jgi:GxxExxY protein
MILHGTNFGSSIGMTLTELPHLNPITSLIIKAAIQVHTHLGPGLLESVYVKCMEMEMRHLGLRVASNVHVPLIYRGVPLESRLTLDLIVNDAVIVETKCVEYFAPIHEAQLLTYMKLTGREAGLLLNFNVAQMADGIKRKLKTAANESSI